MLARHGLDKGQFGLDFGLAALDFDDQQCLRIGRVPGAGKALTGEDGGAVHKLDGDRGPARGHDCGHTSPGIQRRGKPGEQRPRRLGLVHQPNGDFGDHAELPLGTDDQAKQVVTGQVEGLAPDLDHLAFHGHKGHAENVVGGHPVLQAMRPARVHGDIAADGAGDLARWVRRVEQAQIVHGSGDVAVGHPSLHPGGLVLGVDLEDFVHLRKPENHCILLRQRTASQRRPCPARHHRHLVVVAVSEYRCDLRRVFSQHHQHRHGAVTGETIGLIAFELIG